MGETAMVTTEALDKVRESLQRQIDGLRSEVRQVCSGGVPVPASITREKTLEEKLAALDEIRRFREAARPGYVREGAPPLYEEIAREREERTTQILGGPSDA